MSDYTAPAVWSEKPLSEFVKNVIDYRGKTPPVSSEGIPTISAAHVKSGKVVHDGKKFVSQETYQEWTTRGFIEPGDLLITTEAPVGQVAQVPDDRTYLITRRVIALQFDESKANPAFFKYALLSDNARKKLEGLSHGTTVPRVYKDDILKFNIAVPPLQIQNKVATILSAYDSLISNLNSRVSILENMIQAIYIEWFVNFRFKNHTKTKFVDSSIGSTPEGWQVKKLIEIFDFIGGSQPAKKYHIYEQREGYVRFIQNRDYGPKNNLTYIPESSRNKCCERLDIMIDKYGQAGKTRFGLAGAYNVALAKIMPHKLLHREWLRAMISQPRFKMTLAASSMASTRPSLNKSHFILDVLVPPDNICEDFQKIIEPINLLILSYQDKIETLDDIRHILNKNLISNNLSLENIDFPMADSIKI